MLYLLPVFVAVLFLVVGADIRVLIIPWAAVLIVSTTVFACAIGVGFRSIGRAFRLALGSNIGIDDGVREAVILRRLGYLALEAGALGFTTRLIIMLATIDDPARIFGQFILALVPVFYGIWIAAICFPLATRLPSRRYGYTNRAIDAAP